MLRSKSSETRGAEAKTGVELGWWREQAGAGMAVGEGVWLVGLDSQWVSEEVAGPSWCGCNTVHLARSVEQVDWRVGSTHQLEEEIRV